MKLLHAIKFELKKTPWRIVLVMLCALVVMTGIQAYNEVHGEVGFTATRQSKTIMSSSNVKSFTKYAIRYLDIQIAEEKNSKKGPLATPASKRTSNIVIKKSRLLKRAVRQHNNHQLNQTSLDAFKSSLTDHSALVSNALLTSFFHDSSIFTENILQYLVSHHLNASLMLSPNEDVANLMGRTYSLWTLSGSQKSQYVFFVCAILLFSLIFSTEQRRKTTNFMAVVPVRDTTLAFIKGSIGIGIITFGLLAAFFVSYIGIKLSPGGHPWGTFSYPHYFLFKGETHMITIGGYLLTILGIDILWLFLLSGLAFLLTELKAPLLVQVFALSIVTFAQHLHILSAIPSAFRQYLPGNYVIVRELILGIVQTNTPLLIGCLVLAAWGLLFWLGGCLVVTTKRKSMRLN